MARVSKASVATLGAPRKTMKSVLAGVSCENSQSLQNQIGNPNEEGHRSCEKHDPKNDHYSRHKKGPNKGGKLDDRVFHTVSPRYRRK